jgi:hypothetical protein
MKPCRSVFLPVQKEKKTLQIVTSRLLGRLTGGKWNPSGRCFRLHKRKKTLQIVTSRLLGRMTGREWNPAGLCSRLDKKKETLQIVTSRLLGRMTGGEWNPAGFWSRLHKRKKTLQNSIINLGHIKDTKPDCRQGMKPCRSVFPPVQKRGKPWSMTCQLESSLSTAKNSNVNLTLNLLKGHYITEAIYWSSQQYSTYRNVFLNAPQFTVKDVISS